MSTITIYSARDERGNAHYEECQLLTGLGPVHFKGGQAQVTPEQATMLAKNPNIILSQQGGALLAEATSGPFGPGLPLGLQDASVDELDWCADALTAWRAGEDAFDTWTAAHLNELEEERVRAASGDVPPAPDGDEPDGGELEPAPGGEDEHDPDEPRPEDQQVDPSLKAAQDHLRSEGEHVPKALPDGFEPKTGEDESRCYARKGDSTQCTNPAKIEGEHSTYACGLPKHIAQVAKLP